MRTIKIEIEGNSVSLLPDNSVCCAYRQDVLRFSDDMTIWEFKTEFTTDHWDDTLYQFLFDFFKGCSFVSDSVMREFFGVGNELIELSGKPLPKEGINIDYTPSLEWCMNISIGEEKEQNFCS